VEAVRQGYELNAKKAVVKAPARPKPEFVATEKQQKDAQQRLQFEVEIQRILMDLAENPETKVNVLERIERGILSSSYKKELSFEQNLKSPAFTAALFNAYKGMKEE
jgi:methyl coenzyme M reductase subunit D